MAQDFPARTLRIVVPFGPGGVGDLTARAVAQALADALGQGVVIENRPGAGGVAAAETVLKAPADGHTLFLLSNGTAVTAALFKSLRFDVERDFMPVSTLGDFDIAVVARADAPLRTLGDLVGQAKARPGSLNLGSINIGSTQNLAAELLRSAAGIDLQIVPYNGTPALVAALLGGQVDAAVEILGPVLPQVRAGAVRVLAVTGQRRSVVLPQVPTAIESGVPGLVASSWNALAVPAATPAAVVARLQREVAQALARADVQQRLLDLNVAARASTPQEARELLAADIRRWREVIDRAGIPRQ